MDFCKTCDFLLYFAITDEDLTLYCRNCGNKEEQKQFSVGLKKVYKPKKRHINELTKYDPTLFRSSDIPCPNQNCKTNVASSKRKVDGDHDVDDGKVNKSDEKSDEAEDITPEVIHIRYDEENIKYMYLCFHCDTVWETEQ